ncbi:hypothetical protein BSZ36_14350 [Rubricoccus marinus]|uniref:Uncharacterized protein n=1 Tax=Rubricoccus marinus TaxID=716817 RepID=A0A259U267_9BACT|nr:hypothetical protein BSZ36_14350 [Rubricoccus marinus]
MENGPVAEAAVGAGDAVEGLGRTARRPTAARAIQPVSALRRSAPRNRPKSGERGERMGWDRIAQGGRLQRSGAAPEAS